MRFTFDPGQNTGDVIQTPNQARAQIEAGRPKRLPAGGRPFEDRQAGPQGVVHDRFPALPPTASHVSEPGGDIFLERQGGSHEVML